MSFEIHILDLETGEEIRLTHNNVLDGHPDWSPCGTKIVFASYRDARGNPGAGDIYIIDIHSRNITQLTDSLWEDSDPEWSPDGTKIVYKSTSNTRLSGREEIYVMHSDGTNVQRLTTTSGTQSDHDPGWSPDSKTIVFLRFEGTRPWTDLMKPDILKNHWQEIIPVNTHTVDLNGKDKRITNVDHIAGISYFSADGKKILALRLEFITKKNQLAGGNYRLILMDPDGIN